MWAESLCHTTETLDRLDRWPAPPPESDTDSESQLVVTNSFARLPCAEGSLTLKALPSIRHFPQLGGKHPIGRALPEEASPSALTRFFTARDRHGRPSHQYQAGSYRGPWRKGCLAKPGVVRHRVEVAARPSDHSHRGQSDASRLFAVSPPLGFARPATVVCPYARNARCRNEWSAHSHCLSCLHSRTATTGVLFATGAEAQETVRTAFSPWSPSGFLPRRRRRSPEGS